jgi:hypothetical protein
VNDLYYLVTPGRLYEPSPTFVHASGLPQHRGYSSLYAVSKEQAEAIQQEGTTKGFKGVVWSERLWLDFDSYEAAERAGEKLDACGYDFIAYDTGGRGMHFGILRNALPSHLLPNRDKAWARAHFPEADTSIYTHLHLFRLPGAIHERTGRTKHLVHRQPGKPLLLPPLPKEAQGVVPDSSGEASIFNLQRVMANTLPANNGERHHQLVRLVYALRDDAQVSRDTALWWIHEANKLHREPKTFEELERVLASIYEG